jgi:ABC-type branched-subunit amino acid transport system ATPase component
MLKVENLNQYYSGSHILRDLSFEATPGTVTAILGRNGVGKTTLLKCLMGLVPAKTGRISFEGKDITTQPSHARVRAGIGYVPQGREIFPRLTSRRTCSWAWPACRGGTQAAGAHHGAVPGTEKHAQAARRRPLRRPAATARHRPGAGPEPDAC